MITDRKKKKLRRIIETVRRQLGLEDYRLTIRFTTATADRELKGHYALVTVDDDRKTIYVKFNETLVQRMSPGWLRRLAMHELMHSFFWELDTLVEDIFEKAEFSEYRRQAYRNKFLEIEHRKIYRLVRLLAPYSHKPASQPIKPKPKPKPKRKKKKKSRTKSKRGVKTGSRSKTRSSARPGTRRKVPKRRKNRRR